jgi:hypothetical protein
MTQITEDRYYVVWDANDTNKIGEACAATGMKLVGIADEIAGGIVGYVEQDVADEYVSILNQRDVLDAI